VWSGRANRWLVEAAENLRPGTALDLGAGEGADAVWLARQGWLVTAVDFASAGLDRGAEAAEEAGVSDRITWINADLATWQPSERFDLVNVQFLHGSPDFRARVHQLAWLATAGTLVIVGHDPRNATEGHGGPPDLTRLYGAEDVLDSLGMWRNSAEVLVAERRTRHADDPALVALDCVVVLRRPDTGEFSR